MTRPDVSEPRYGEPVAWEPAAPRISLLRLLVSLGRADGVGLRRRAARPRRRARPARRGRGRRARRSRSLNAIVPPMFAALRLPFMVAIGFILDPVRRRGPAAARRPRVPRLAARRTAFGDALLVALLIVGGRASCCRSSRAPTTTTSTRCASRAAIARRLGTAGRTDCRGSSSSRSTAWRCRSCAARCATATRRRWRAGSPITATAWPSGRPTCPRRPAPARPASCSAPTRTSRRSAGSRRRPRR